MRKPEESEEVIGEFLLLLKEFDRIEHTFEIRGVQENFSSSLLRIISKDKAFTKLVTPSKFLEKETDFYNSLSDEEYLSIVKKYVSETDLRASLKTAFSKSIV